MIMDEEQQQHKKKLRWFPLEMNPEVWNKIIQNNGVSSEWSFIDILGFDDASLADLPKSVEAIIFLFKGTPAYFEFREEQESYLKIHEQSISPNLIYFKQTIGNACGMMALLHALANNDHLVDKGVFRSIFDATKTMSPQERGEYLETCEELAVIHDVAAHEGQTQVPDIDLKCNNHFVCFVKVDEHLYELDGSRPFPINHGKCSNLVEESAKFMRQCIDRSPDVAEYGAMAFTKTP